MKKDWTDTKVEEIADLLRGISYKKDQISKIPTAEYLPVLRANNINGRLNFYDLVYVPERLIKPEQLIKKGDIIFAMSSGSKHLVGKSAQAENDIAGSYGAFCALLRPSTEISKEYVASFFQSYSFKKLIGGIAKGTNINNLKREHILGFNIPIPPLPIQRAIVAKIEELFSDLDKGIAYLKKAQAQLVVYRQAVLKKAFEGELTKEWREKQTNLPSAEELLDQIKEERQKHYSQQLEDWKKAVKDWEENGKKGKKPGKPKKLNDYKNVDSPIQTNPKKWITSNLEQIGFWTGGGTPSKSNMSFWTNGTVLWVTSKDMKSKDIFDSQNKITPESIDQSSAKLINENSVLVVLRSGILRRILPVAINRTICTVNQDLQAITPYSVKTEFIYWFLVANEFDIRHKCAKDGTTVESVEANALKSYAFPYCSKAEQHQIVQEIESRLSVCNQVEQSITESLEKAQALRQSILKKAFEGALLSEGEIAQCKKEKDYEPANVLLKKIRNEKLAKQLNLKPQK